MTDVWVTIAGLFAITIVIRAVGPVLLGGRDLPGRLPDVIPLLAPALLSALVVTETVGGADGFDVDERLAGVAAAGVVLGFRRDALLPAIAVAAAVTALARALI
jgi:branched-subunit amino acid transport protein